MNKPIILGRVLPKSGKIHQNQEVYHTGGGNTHIESKWVQRPI